MANFLQMEIIPLLCQSLLRDFSHRRYWRSGSHTRNEHAIGPDRNDRAEPAVREHVAFTEIVPGNSFGSRWRQISMCTTGVIDMPVVTCLQRHIMNRPHDCCHCLGSGPNLQFPHGVHAEAEG